MEGILRELREKGENKGREMVGREFKKMWGGGVTE